MSDLTARRLGRGEKALNRRLEGGEKLYPTVEVKLSPADIEYYQSLGPWAMALDRQSKKAELQREQATGQENRVRNCLWLAREKGVTLPEPVERKNRKDGEFQFSFDEGACRYHWFVDGMLGDASGFTASPLARLRLWQAAKTCRLLRDRGCAPRYIVIGELTRFFRNQRQFLDWYHILKDSGTSVCIYGCPELTPETEEMLLPTYLSSVAAQSMWLRRSHQMARETFRLRKQLFHTRAPFSLTFNLDRTSDGYRREVLPHPVEWPLIQEWVNRIYEGKITSKGEAVAWLGMEARVRGVPVERIPTSHTWVTTFLSGPILEGVYWQYKQRGEPCRVEDEEMNSDWDLTPTGKRRYVVQSTPEESVAFPVLLQMGQGIPRERLLVARQQFKGRSRSSPSTTPKALSLKNAYDQSLFRRGVIFCAVCGSVVHEIGPRCHGGPQKDQHWTREEDLQLLSLIHSGYTSERIAQQFGCPLHRVQTRRKVMKLRGKDHEKEREGVEAWWADPFRRRMASWHLYCRCIGSLQVALSLPIEKVKELPEVQHQRKRAGSLSLALEPLVLEALKRDPRFDPWVVDPRDNHDLGVLEVQEQQVRGRLRKIQAAYEADDWAFYTREEAVARLAELRQEHAQIQAKIAATKGTLLDSNDRQDALAWEETRALLTRMIEHPRFKENLEFRRRVMELCVRRVTVNLETGEFVAETEFRADALHQLCGRVLLGEVVTSERVRGHAFLKHIRSYLRGKVLLAA